MTSPDAAVPAVRDARFDRAACGLLTTTMDGEVIEANRTLARWLGQPPASLVGARFAALLEPSSRLMWETRHAQVLHMDGAVSEVALVLLGADGTTIPVLVSSVVDAEGGGDGDEPVVRTAVFGAAERTAYEQDLLRARRAAEASEARVRILQDISGEFGMSVNDQEVVDSFVSVARRAFAAAAAAVHLFDEDGDLPLVAGVNPLWGVVPPIPALRNTPREVVVIADDVRESLPELAAGLDAARYEAMSITPLFADGTRLGVLVCFFGRARDFGDDFLELQRALGRQASQTLVRVRLQRELERLALYDALTGIPNRQFVENRLDEAIAEAAENGTPLAVIFIDVDAFKAINDTFGHATGDRVLHSLAQRLRRSVRAGDTVGRHGGDEFIAICADADEEAAQAIAERIREHSHDPVETASGPAFVSVSVGVAVYRPSLSEAPTATQLLIRADAAMYTSKENGKDRVSVARPPAGM